MVTGRIVHRDASVVGHGHVLEHGHVGLVLSMLIFVSVGVVTNIEVNIEVGFGVGLVVVSANIEVNVDVGVGLVVVLSVLSVLSWPSCKFD